MQPLQCLWTYADKPCCLKVYKPSQHLNLCLNMIQKKLKLGKGNSVCLCAISKRMEDSVLLVATTCALFSLFVDRQTLQCTVFFSTIIDFSQWTFLPGIFSMWTAGVVQTIWHVVKNLQCKGCALHMDTPQSVLVLLMSSEHCFLLYLNILKPVCFPFCHSVSELLRLLKFFLTWLLLGPQHLNLIGNQKPFSYCWSFYLDLILFPWICLKSLFTN